VNRFWFHVFVSAALGALVGQPAFAQNQREARQQARELQGKVVRRGADQFVVQTSANKQITFYTSPQTKYLMNDRVVQFTDLRVGSNITAAYTLDRDRYIATNVTLVAAEPAIPVRPGRAVEVAPPAESALMHGRVVRIVGKDQVVIRTADNKEVIVFVGPETVYQLTREGGQLSDLRADTDIGVYYDKRHERPMARQVFGVSAEGAVVQGTIARVVGTDQIVVKTSDGKEVMVYVDPKTAYQLNNQPIPITELRPGYPVGVYYETLARRPTARRIYGWRR
jgi:translation initiation factor IF-1